MNAFLFEDGRLRVGWRFASSVVVIVVAYFAAGIMAATFAGKHSRVEDLIFSSLLFLLILGGFVGIARIFDQPEGGVAVYLGLPRRNCFRQTMAGALLGFALIFLAIVAIAVFCNYHIVRVVLTPRTLDSAAAALLAVLAGAMAEELSFRGYPFQRMVEAVGRIRAAALMSALFAAAHMTNPHVSDNRTVAIFAFVNTLLIGIVLAIAYLRTQALWFSWGLHFSWNLTLGMIFGLPVSGQNDFATLVRARATGPDWLLGGAYGIEGGFLGSVVILLGLACVLTFVPPANRITPPKIDEGSPLGIQPAETV
jgi:uncharacterized protein